MPRILRGGALVGEAVVGERPVHRLDDVAALADLAQRRLGARRDRPKAGLDFGREPQPWRRGVLL